MSLLRKSFRPSLTVRFSVSLSFVLLLILLLPLPLGAEATAASGQPHSVVVSTPAAPAAGGCGWTGMWVATIKKSDLETPAAAAVAVSRAAASRPREPEPAWLLLGFTLPALALLQRRKQPAVMLLVGSLLGILIGCQIDLEFEEITIEMKLTQADSRVSGTYTAKMDGEALEGVGTISGTISGNTLTGALLMDEDAIEIVATMSADCRSLASQLRAPDEEETFGLAWARTSGIMGYDIDPGNPEGEPLWVVDAVFLNGEEITSEHTSLYKGGKITTGPGISIRLTYQAGARVVVRENSEFQIQEIKVEGPGVRTMTTRLIQGIVDFYTTPTYNEKFEIDTNRVVVGIKGTQLTVEHTSDITHVTVQEGEVEVRDKTSGAVSSVRAGETAKFDGTSTPPPPGTQTIEQALDTNLNNSLDDAEIRQAVQYWILGQAVPGTNQTIDDAKIRQLIQMWILGEPVSASAAAAATPARAHPLSLRAVNPLEWEIESHDPGIVALHAQLYDLNGRLLLQEHAAGPRLHFALRTRAGMPLANGVYLYVVTAQGADGATWRSQIGKLAVLR